MTDADVDGGHQLGASLLALLTFMPEIYEERTFYSLLNAPTSIECKLAGASTIVILIKNLRNVNGERQIKRYM